MKAVKFLAVLVGGAVGWWLAGWLIDATQPPKWALLSTLVICVAVFYAKHEIKRDLARDLARIKCELSGHWPPQFNKWGDGYCPRCKDEIASRAMENKDSPGLQLCEDTLHQRLSRLEAALGVEE